MNGIEELSIEGRIATPEDADWDQARQAWNLAADPHPSAVAFVESADDIAEGGPFRRATTSCKVAGQGTGHGAVALGSLDDTIVIKTERMRGIEVDADAGRRGSRPACSRSSSARRPADTALLAAGLVARRRRHRLHARRRAELARPPPWLRL